MPEAPAGHHILLDLFDCECPAARLEHLAIGQVQLWEELEKDVRKVRTIGHQFDPTGYSIVTLLMESHMSIHTWPQNKFVSLDFYSCAGQFPRHLADKAKAYFNPRKIIQQEYERGSGVRVSTPIG